MSIPKFMLETLKGVAPKLLSLFENRKTIKSIELGFKAVFVILFFNFSFKVYRLSYSPCLVWRTAFSGTMRRQGTNGRKL